MADPPASNVKTKALFPEKYFSKLRKKERCQTIETSKTINRKRKRKRMFNRKKMKMANTKKYLHNQVEWYKHQVTYWKTRALNLESENQMMHEHIRKCYDMDPFNSDPKPKYTARKSIVAHADICPTTITPNYMRNEKRDIDMKIETETSGIEESEIEFEINEHWIKFMEQSERHREEMRKQREKTKSQRDVYFKRNDGEEEYLCDNSESLNFSKEMYGEGAPKIRAFEQAIQYNYERYFKRNKPQYWPILPLKF